MIIAIRASASGALGSRFTPKGASVTARTSSMAVRNSANVMVADARIPNPPARAVAAVSDAPETQPIPVCTIGSRTANNSVARVDSSFTGWEPRARAVRRDR